MRAPAAYSLIFLAFLALLFFSKEPEVGRSHRRHGPGRRLVVRTKLLAPGRHRAAAFDPIVAEYEEQREERAWVHHQAQPKPAMPMEAQPDPFNLDPDYFEDEDYLNDELHFNLTRRLQFLFPLIDTDHDRAISFRELEDWHVQQGLKAARHRSDRDFRAHDANKDGLVTFSEYLPDITPEQISNHSMEHGGAGWWKEQFDLADEDGDGALNLAEYNSFINPEDSTNPKLRVWLRTQEIIDHDTDKDGKLSWKEFDINMYATLRDHGRDELIGLTHRDQTPEERRLLASRAKFGILDANGDNFLTEDELEPVMDQLHPGESYYAKQQAEQLMQQADDNRDGFLTAAEMERHPYAFYSTIVEDADYDYAHLELR